MTAHFIMTDTSSAILFCVYHFPVIQIRRTVKTLSCVTASKSQTIGYITAQNIADSRDNKRQLIERHAL